ncbi:hypothetical protein [Absidia glauca]|uniref:Uncharacterized protein n=1 Tax=Absidia glauca TaxID=4829 RepID=A0A168NAU1_ABSGL|nr:hypothetical protein [Absidia glauca]
MKSKAYHFCSLCLYIHHFLVIKSLRTIIMSLETNNTGSSAALHGKQDNVVDAVYDFSTLCDELDDGYSVEDNEDASILFEHGGNDDELGK